MQTNIDFTTQPRVALPGSHREPFTTSSATAPVPTQAGAGQTSGAQPHHTPPHITVSVIVRRREPINAGALGTPAGRLTRAAYQEQHGPDPDAIALVRSFADQFGLEILAKQPGPRTLQISGPLHAVERAFGVTLTQESDEGTAYRVREGSIHLPEALIGAVEAVLGLDTRPQAEPHLRFLPAQAAATSFTPVEVAQLYGFPAGATAHSQTIGIIELGGGYREADLTTYFGGLGLPMPQVTAISVDGGKNSPGDASGADGEVMLDIEVCAAVAPGAKIAVYFAPNTDQGFVNAITTAVHDTANDPSVLSISWGGPETSWTAQARDALDQACQSAAALGITITAASGDNGSADGTSGAAVDFPASSPHVLGCGGTRLDVRGNTIQSEVVWNETANGQGATGGGVSTAFPLPSWQTDSNVPMPAGGTGGRGVPDVAGDADPITGYIVRVDGQTMTIGGTSAVAPLWAALIALSNHANGNQAGFLHPIIYASSARGAFRDITQGNNGAFAARPGWDACTGLGSPVGSAVIELLKNIAA